MPKISNNTNHAITVPGVGEHGVGAKIIGHGESAEVGDEQFQTLKKSELGQHLRSKGKLLFIVGDQTGKKAKKKTGFLAKSEDDQLTAIEATSDPDKLAEWLALDLPENIRAAADARLNATLK